MNVPPVHEHCRGCEGHPTNTFDQVGALTRLTDSVQARCALMGAMKLKSHTGRLFLKPLPNAKR
jgi:hypothetical protein